MRISRKASALAACLWLVTSGPGAAQSALQLKERGPRIVSVEVEEGAQTHRVNAQGTPVTILSGRKAVIRLAGLPPGATVEVMKGTSDLSIAQSRELNAMPVATRCRAKYSGYTPGGARPSVVRATASATGTATLDFSLSFALPDDGRADGETGPCSGPLAFRITPATRTSLKTRSADIAGNGVQYLMTPAFTIRPWTRYHYENTAALDAVFAFTMKGEGASLCSGTSIGPRSYPIGMHTRGGDLAVQVRSGPLGTVCKAISPGVVLPEDVRLIAIDWAIERDGTRCEASDAAAARVGEQGIFQPGHLPDDVPDFYMLDQPVPSNRRQGIPQPTPGADQHIVGFAHAWMWCDRTAVNDHGVRIVLRSATFEGPANARLPRP